MDISENAEEALESLWEAIENDQEATTTYQDWAIGIGDDTITELIDLKLISLLDNRVSLTAKGFLEAENTIRRHRLAERLLVDVLDTESALVEDAACKFEHVIREGIEENICILLGHPQICPHGKPIPQGKCCQEDRKQADRVVTALANLQSNQTGRIAYIHAEGRTRLQKLMALGITPGASIKMIQTFPSYVFQIGRTQLAVDEEIANEIYVISSRVMASK
jgi:DtxR family Mn-dependent transcriptional regulator